MIFITLPRIYPLMSAAGSDLIWLGVAYTITLEIAVVTPPVGLNFHVIQAISREQVTIADVIMRGLRIQPLCAFATCADVPARVALVTVTDGGSARHATR